jgi:hypothetical protein
MAYGQFQYQCVALQVQLVTMEKMVLMEKLEQQLLQRVVHLHLDQQDLPDQLELKVIKVMQGQQDLQEHKVQLV